jgi:hypothetical protein
MSLVNWPLLLRGIFGETLLEGCELRLQALLLFVGCESGGEGFGIRIAALQAIVGIAHRLSAIDLAFQPAEFGKR